mmetsp:Transcript_54375/g.80667  ORF Transcript_54375/g.80667 Transcript_54375/m.80667 type:complete len:205 (-) Transcript_54375:1591-2205(-)
MRYRQNHQTLSRRNRCRLPGVNCSEHLPRSQHSQFGRLLGGRSSSAFASSRFGSPRFATAARPANRHRPRLLPRSGPTAAVRKAQGRLQGCTGTECDAVQVSEQIPTRRARDITNQFRHCCRTQTIPGVVANGVLCAGLGPHRSHSCLAWRYPTKQGRSCRNAAWPFRGPRYHLRRQALSNEAGSPTRVAPFSRTWGYRRLSEQ